MLTRFQCLRTPVGKCTLCAVLWLALYGILLAVPARADQLTGGSAGLTSPTSTITFDELGNLQGQVITNQFAAFGATFTGFGWDNATRGQAGSTGFSGGDLVNGLSPFPSGSMTISFNQLVSGAAFAAVDQGGIFLIQAFQGGTTGTLIDAFSVTIPPNPGIGFIGFQNDTPFNTIEISTAGNSALSIDNLEMQTAAVPEPSSLLLLGTGLVGLVGAMRRKRPA